MATVTVLYKGVPKCFDGDKLTELIKYIRKVFPGGLLKLDNDFYLAKSKEV